ncbi:MULTISPECIES: aminotransferase class V-fold PLP-dependent enzyme [unclassified Leptolyngbya]|uniref:aminotransferase class V-fold PLP-dependent enzyme n=1 Tax=unclassified Leptolyngbya TaxID=2650499 RepID=UPI0016865877|nr:MULTISPECIES: aminotransferase class V-fold PLP-dependent enzyme [unclassified Leptolyngbya]MBD1913690.1 aminotransferase class V-fold PLP-dependent enzyme [Leptolyngbya sp. FACHB-8]MBD2156381.1 aminotransferase class V-fold PLP-dependent enzyme [Leptolyngbya sp. FACHB-16]
MTQTFDARSTLVNHRQHFPALLNKSYFNYGGQGPMPQGAIDALLKAHLYGQEHGPFSRKIGQWETQQMSETRGAIATELQVSPTTITLTEAVSTGCNIPLWGLDWQPGDQVLVSDCEHPGIVAAINEICRRFGVESRTFPLLDTLNTGEPVERLQQGLTPKTRMVVLSHILWNTGQVLPLKEMVEVCHQYPGDRGPVRVLVDAAQSAGVLPLSLADTGVDFYAFTGHKWFCGPAGLGALYVSPEAMDVIHPTYVGWRAITQTPEGQPTGWLPDGRRFEVATSDYTLLPALREAIALHNRWGTTAERFSRICQLSGYLWRQLQTVDGIACLRATAPEAGLVSFTAANRDPGPVVQALEDRNIFVRVIRHPNCIRASVHYLTLESELDQLVEALREILAA